MSEQTIRLLVVGDSGVGKSALTRKFICNEFSEDIEPTVGVDCFLKTITVDEIECKFEIWDTGGTEQYRSLPPSYYRRAAGALVVYDISNRESFEGLASWLLELKVNGEPNVCTMIVGNKSDCEKEVSRIEGLEFALRHGAMFFETSAKNNESVTEIYEEIARKIIESYIPQEIPHTIRLEQLHLSPKNAFQAIINALYDNLRCNIV